MNFDEYLKLDKISSTQLKAASKSVYDAYMCLNFPFEPTDAMEFGTAVHTALLEPQLFNKKYKTVPSIDKRKAEYKDALNSVKAENKTPLQEDDFNKIKKIYENCRKNIYVSQWLNAADKEKTIIWDDYKARLDMIHDGFVIDLKTTRDASPDGFKRQFIQLRYDIQMYHYMLGAQNELDAREDLELFMVAIESSSCEIAVYRVNEMLDFLNTRDNYLIALENLNEAKKLKEIPGKYSSEIVNMTM